MNNAIASNEDRDKFTRDYVGQLEAEIKILRHALSVCRDFISNDEYTFYYDGDTYDHWNSCCACGRKQGKCEGECQRAILVELLGKTA